MQEKRTKNRKRQESKMIFQKYVTPKNMVQKNPPPPYLTRFRYRWYVIFNIPILKPIVLNNVQL